MCESCLEKIDKMVKDKYGQSANLEVVTTCNFKTGVCRSIVPPLKFSFYEKKKDGKDKQKPTRSFIYASHCQFCGVKLP